MGVSVCTRWESAQNSMTPPEPPISPSNLAELVVATTADTWPAGGLTAEQIAAELHLWGFWPTVDVPPSRRVEWLTRVLDETRYDEDGRSTLVWVRQGDRYLHHELVSERGL